MGRAVNGAVVDFLLRNVNFVVVLDVNDWFVVWKVYFLNIKSGF